MDLIIVESPSKAKTISKYLKGKYRVDASGGERSLRQSPEECGEFFRGKRTISRRFGRNRRAPLLSIHRDPQFRCGKMQGKIQNCALKRQIRTPFFHRIMRFANPVEEAVSGDCFPAGRDPADLTGKRLFHGPSADGELQKSQILPLPSRGGLDTDHIADMEPSGKLRLKFSASPVERADRLLTAPKLLFRLLETAEPLFEREQFRFPLRQRGSRQRIPRP